VLLQYFRCQAKKLDVHDARPWRRPVFKD